MKYSKEFVELDKTIHDRTSFDCGESELNDFIQKYAAKHMEAGISTTMVLPASKPLPDGKYPICAFYTIAPSAIKKESLPESRKKKLPHYPVPVFLIAQMAVHNDCKGQGLGKINGRLPAELHDGCRRRDEAGIAAAAFVFQDIAYALLV